MRDQRRVFVLDIDDTLYLERDYVRSGFAAVGRMVKDRFGFPSFEEHCHMLLEQGVQGAIFDQALALASLSCNEKIVKSLVDLYRSHKPSIAILQDAQAFLEKPGPIAFISDGPLISQQRKAESLGLQKFSNVLLLTDQWGREFWKPHPRAFETVEQHFSSYSAFTYIGDNPAKDFIAPKNLGWETIRIRRPGGLHRDVPNLDACCPDREIDSFEKISACDC
ncbi:MAG: HAD family hydrolase [Planctomycetes bacterium]|nr:HAD family hydrolase [Planctomycetota bacterium]